MKVIVNADDFGISENINHIILEMMSRRRVTSATLMANSPLVGQVIQELHRFPYISFGVHLNLTNFQPLSGYPKDLALLLNAQGEFCHNIERVRFTPRLLQAVAHELSLQIEHLLATGIKISHLDSHHHVHTLPPLFPVLKYLQRKYRIRKVRITRNFHSPGKQYTGLLLKKKQLYNFALKYLFRTKTTDGFSDLPTFCAYAKRKGIPCRSFEIMVHPGESKEADDLLTSRWEADLPYRLNFINYDEL